MKFSPLQNDKVIHNLLNLVIEAKSEKQASKLWDEVMDRRAEIGEIPTALWLVADDSTVKGYVDACPSLKIMNGAIQLAAYDLDNILDYVMAGINLAFNNKSTFSKEDLDKIVIHVIGNFKVYSHLALRRARKVAA